MGCGFPNCGTVVREGCRQEGGEHVQMYEHNAHKGKDRSNLQIFSPLIFFYN